MKENPYDNSVFFAKYGEMLRSKKGLNGAGEWREFQKLLPGFAGKRVLDLGCGYGWHCSYAAEHGAVTVLGTDISEKMIRTAIRKNSHPQITYHLAAMEDLDFADASFDDWYYGADGEILHFPVDHYYYEGKRDAVFLGEHVTKYHRTLTTYLQILLQNGFSILDVIEPMPPEDMMDLPGMKDEMRRPMMLLISAQKQADR